MAIQNAQIPQYGTTAPRTGPYDTKYGNYGTGDPNGFSEEEAAAQRTRATNAQTGQMSLEQLREQARLQQEAEARRFSQISGLFGSGPGQLGPQVAHPGGGPGGPEAVAQADSQARFKEKVGQVGRGAMTALKETMSGRGMAGSGVEGQGMTDVINSGQSDLINKISSDEAATLKRGYDVNDQVYQGNIQQRGQMAQMYPSLMGVIASRLY